MADGPELDIRSYDAPGPAHQHPWPQLVLPLSGQIAIAVAGRKAELSAGRMAFVAGGLAHSQQGRSPNQALIVDLVRKPVAAAVLDVLSERPFPRLCASATRLIASLAQAVERQRRTTPTLRLSPRLDPLIDPLLGPLLDQMARDAEGPIDRLDALLAAIDLDPAGDWRMARLSDWMGLGSSRLHEVFRVRTGTTPHDRVIMARLQRARTLLTGSALPIAEIATRCGFADQSALTRALRQRFGQTPAALRAEAIATP